MHQFDEHHPELKGFSAFYEVEILPMLERGELARLEGLAKTKKALPLIFGVVILGVLMATYFKWPIFAFVIIFFMGGVGAAATYFTFLKGVSATTKMDIVGGICRFLEWSFSVEVESPPRFESFKRLGLVPSNYNRSSFEDIISGQAHGAAFQFYEAKLEQKRKRKNSEHWVTIFRGQVLALDFDQKFLGTTIVLRDSGFFNRKKKGDMKRVGLVDPVFEKIFEAYGTDQVEARYLLTPTFMQRLVDLENSVDGKNIRFGFSGGQLLIAVETGNRYEAGSMLQPLVETARTQKILDEIGAIYDIIDSVTASKR